MSAESLQNLFTMERMHELTRGLRLAEEGKGRSIKNATIKKNISDIFQCLICFNKI